MKLNSVDILVAENGKAHYTYDYELMERTIGAELVLRRGQPFNLALKLNRNYNPETDGISLVFNVVGNGDSSPKYSSLHLHFLIVYQTRRPTTKSK